MKTSTLPATTSRTSEHGKPKPLPKALPIGAIIAAVILVPALMTSAFAPTSAVVSHRQAVAQAQQAVHAPLGIPTIDEASAAARHFFESIGGHVDKWAQGESN